MIWAILLAFFLYWFVVRETPMYFSMPTVGFWTSCVEDARPGGPAGDVSPDLNAEAAHYIATVYGYHHAGKMLRRSLAFAVAGWVATLYLIWFLLLSGVKPLYVGVAFAVCGVLFAASGILWLGVVWKTKKDGHSMAEKTLAIQEIHKIQHGPQGPAIEKALRHIVPSQALWWPYPQGRGRFFKNMGKLLAISMPIAYAVMAFIQSHTGLSPYIHPHNLLGFTLALLGFAVEWTLFASALVWWGDWRGAEISSWETFPLHILLKDIADLTC